MDRKQARRAAWVLTMVGLLLVVMGGRLVHIHLALGDRLRAMADRQHQSRAAIPARRGMVFDARGRVVALSRELPDVYVDPSLVRDVNALTSALAARLNLSSEQIARNLERRPSTRYVVIARRVDAVTAAAVRAMKNPAVGLTNHLHRYYPLGASMSHVIGWVGLDGHGLSGLELTYDKHLSGRDGYRGFIRNAHRRALDRRETTSRPPIDGGHLVLTLDAEIQRMAEEALAESIQHFEAESGIILAISPRSGDILAMAGVPAFDPNEPYTDEEASRRRNRALTDPIEPGSTFKPFIAAAALLGGYITPTEQFDCHLGSYRFGKRLIRDTHPHGLLDVRGIITHSSNIGMGQIGQRMGNGPLYEAVRRFGFGQTTGVDCVGEAAGVVHPLSRWTEYSTTSIPIGYEVLVTPLQLLNAFSALVNDGVLLRPRLVKRLLGPNGECIRCDEPPEVVRRVVPRSLARYITRDLLVSVVEHGGGRRASLGRYKVLGKTGTPKLTYRDRPGYEEGAYLGLFLGAAPVDDPQIAALAILRKPNPRIGYYGSVVAAPVVGRLLDEALMYWGVPPDQPRVASGL